MAAIVPIGSLITATGATLVALYLIVALSAIIGRRNGTTAAAPHDEHAVDEPGGILMGPALEIHSVGGHGTEH